jgi:EmrB/QacA subfamily drug resistance transporter
MRSVRVAHMKPSRATPRAAVRYDRHMDAAPSTLADEPTNAAHVHAEATPNFTHGQILRVITGVLLCILLAAIDQTVVVPAVPAIAADLHGFGHLSWIVSAYLLTSTAATPIYGRLSDIYGRRALLLPAIALFVVASMLCAVSGTLWQLIAFRALQGVGGAGLMAMSQAAIADVVAPRERGRYQAYMAGTWGVASVAGPILGGWVTDDLTWRWIFWINVPIGVGAFVLSDRALKLLKVRPMPARIDYAGAALLTLTVTACLLVMSWGGIEYAWGSPQVLALILASVLLLAALVVRELRAPDPLLPPRLFANSVFTRGVIIASFAAAAMFGGTFLLPLFFQLLHGADAATSGTLVVPFLAANVVGAYIAGQLARKLGRVKVIVLGGLLLSVIGYALLAVLGSGTSHLVAVLDMLVVGFGLGITMPSVLVIVQNAAERRDVGVATGTLLFLRSMGAALGSTLVGTLLAARFAAGLAASGASSAGIDLGALREHAGAQLALSPQVRAAAMAGLSGGFHIAFLACAALAGIGWLTCLGLRDLPLKSSAGQ